MFRAHMNEYPVSMTMDGFINKGLLMQALDFANYLAWAKCNCTYVHIYRILPPRRCKRIWRASCADCNNLSSNKSRFIHSCTRNHWNKYPITFVEKFTPKIPATAWQRLDRMVTSVHLSKVTRSMPAWVWLRLPDSPPSWSMFTTSKHKCLCCWNKYEL